ncbi:magnesium transporter [Metaclostridioides mangenotii]|uniref:magnesium transporter n=1 Tax=Metaclostridioides mangenotii TaxID=1540 RepID=UPI000487ED57|nr:magnesium transporter [Clostridioides mangenotii]
MDRKQETSGDLLSEVISLIDANKLLELRELIEEYHIMDILDIIENLDEAMQIKMFEVLPLDMAAAILEESDSDFFISVLSKIDVEHTKNILELMSLGDMAGILNKIDEKEREKIINLLSEEDAKDVKELLFYDEDTAGGTMTTGYIAVNKDMTALQAIDHMREEAEEAETIYYIYVVDDKEKLVGVLSLRELIIARDKSIIGDLMSENLVSVYVDEDREEAVRLVSKYNLVTIPVIDRQGVLKGIITVDDIIDVMEEEATEDMYKIAGSSEHERGLSENEHITIKEQVMSSIRGRTPWLIISLIGGFISTMILYNIGDVLNPTYAPLVFFIPLVIGMGGNTGTQSASVTVINISSNKDLDYGNVLREFLVGLMTGLICSIITGIAIFMFTKTFDVTFVVSIAVFINMALGATLGALLPVILNRIDADPTTISAPIISTALDITGLVVYFTIATILLSKIAL